MFDIKRRKEFHTVGDLKKLLNNVSDDASVFIIGDDYCWFHIEEDGTTVYLDNEDLEDEYDESLDSGGEN